MYHRQLALARSNRDRGMEAAACGALGIAHRLLKRLDKALGKLKKLPIFFFFHFRIEATIEERAPRWAPNGPKENYIRIRN